MSIRYSAVRKITPAQFIDLLKRSTLSQRRPVNAPARIKSMLRHANLVCSAWHGPKLVGVARSVTDFSYCCYVADLAVDVAFQKRGIGRELLRRTRSKLGNNAMIVLLAAPKARQYYPRIGFEAHPSAWILHPGMKLK